jgi:hypothetical protein
MFHIQSDLIINGNGSESATGAIYSLINDHYLTGFHRAYIVTYTNVLFFKSSLIVLRLLNWILQTSADNAFSIDVVGSPSRGPNREGCILLSGRGFTESMKLFYKTHS